MAPTPANFRSGPPSFRQGEDKGPGPAWNLHRGVYVKRSFAAGSISLWGPSRYLGRGLRRMHTARTAVRSSIIFDGRHPPLSYHKHSVIHTVCSLARRISFSTPTDTAFQYFFIIIHAHLALGTMANRVDVTPYKVHCPQDSSGLCQNPIRACYSTHRGLLSLAALFEILRIQ